ncbi:hypothetical protein ANCCAN_17890 [Ancylostoma caninum]|uniref:Uncharacterized protein n=1 Tax=Ancylostoma caninum TaxID=29170 RepID=A0A368FVI2_ANCCA|nr:hypothetical protein ANCCAN_17890 [Ancylostoma caninum]
MELCWKWAHCSVPTVLIVLHGLILVLGTLGWLCSSPTFCAFLLVLPISCCGAIIGVIANYWISNRVTSLEYYLTSPTTLGFLSVLALAAYAITVIMKYCEYVKRLQYSKRRTGFNVDVFKERVFGTPPLKEFNRMEFARCADLSDSHIDDIFGDYEPNVALY